MKKYKPILGDYKSEYEDFNGYSISCYDKNYDLLSEDIKNYQIFPSLTISIIENAIQYTVTEMKKNNGLFNKACPIPM